MMWKREIRKFLVHNRIVAVAFMLAAFMAVTMAAPGTVYGVELADEELFGASTATGQTDNTDTTGDVGQQTPQEFEGEVLKSDVADMTRIDYETTYDPMTDTYYKYVEGYGNTAIATNVPNGMYTQEEVKVSVATGIIYTMYKDGVAMTDLDISAITEPGSYALAVYDGTGNPVTPLSFTILGTYTNISRIDMPEGCDIVSVTYEGESIVSDETSLLFEEEGQFEIVCECPMAGRTYNLKLVRDTTAPVLALEEVDEKGFASGPVNISDLETDATCLILRNDEVVDVTPVLKESGHYSIALTDSAGNHMEYSFTIKVYFNYLSITFLLLFVALIAGLVAYIMVSKKRLRVR